MGVVFRDKYDNFTALATAALLISEKYWGRLRDGLEDFRFLCFMENAFDWLFNPFHTTGLFLHPLETSEKPRFMMFSRVIERDQWYEMA